MESNNPKIALPLSRKHMPKTFNISLDKYFDRQLIGSGYREGEPRIPVSYGPQQSMDGFEVTYKNIIDYIVRITHRIWEERDVEYIEDTYCDASRVYDDYGLQFGNKKIISDTRHTTGAFSDIELIADEVIWAGDDQVGYHTSHRTIIKGTNDGNSKYGPATGKSVNILVIANCVAKDNKIFLEHVLYNNSSLLRQLGFCLVEVAEEMCDAFEHDGWPRNRQQWSNLRGDASPHAPISQTEPVSGFDPDSFCRTAFNIVWTDHEYSRLLEFYTEDVSFLGPTDTVCSGLRSLKVYFASITHCFFDLKLQVDEVYWMGNDMQGYISSIRWSAEGTHMNDGKYGGASGTSIQLWGITQHLIRNKKIVREWTLFNELDLMMQIAKHRRESQS